MPPKLSIITIVLNNKQFFEYTLKSVREQNFEEFEYIVIDGGSTDGTLDIIKENQTGINFWVSEPDRGIYDAMNKGLNFAKGEWIIYLNAGDRFADANVLSHFFELKNLSEVDFVFGNWFTCNLLKNPDSLIPGFANYEKGAILHQSVIYKKKLHDLYGNYLITPKLIISDYIFFLTIPKSRVFHFERAISINDNTGVSTAPWSYKQKLAVDFVFGRITAFRLVYLFIKFMIPRFDRFIINKVSELTKKK